MSLDHAGNYYCINPPTREPESEVTLEDRLHARDPESRLTLEDRVRYLERRVKDLQRLNQDDISILKLAQRVSDLENHNSIYIDMDIRLTSRVAVLEKKCT